MSDRKTKGGHESGDTPVSELAVPAVLFRGAAGARVEHVYTVTARDKGGQEAAVTVGPVEGAVYYAEYWTGWKRVWRRTWRLGRGA